MFYFSTDLTAYMENINIGKLANNTKNTNPGSSLETCTFRFTSPKNFEDARAECQSYGGDLIHKNFGPAGAANHE